MESLEARARKAGEAKRQAVRDAHMSMRYTAPEIYTRALHLHYVSLGVLPEAPERVASLEVMVQAHPERAQLVLDVLALAEADGADYARIMSTLRSMLARHASTALLDEIEKGEKR